MAGELTLCSDDGADMCVLRPDQGAALARLVLGGRDILRVAPPNAQAATDMACFIMAPWVNRIAQGQFSWRDRTVVLPPEDSSSAPHAIHGQVWLKPWRVLRQARQTATLTCEGGGDAWPWPYRAQFEIDLSPKRFSSRLNLFNCGDAAMPAGIGLHPYFIATPQTTLEFQAETLFAPDADLLPQPAAAIGPAHDFSRPRFVRGAGLDHGYGGWDGHAQLGGVSIQATGCRYLQVYAPAEHDYICVEPQTAPANAVHLLAAPFAVLEPGEHIAMTLTLAID